MFIYNNNEKDYSIKNLCIEDLLNQKYCLLDLEATGLDYNNEYIIQVGAILVEKGKVRYEKVYNTYVKSPIPIPEKIQKLTHINDSQITDAPTFSEIYNSLKEFFSDSILVAQCGFEFDFALLEKECEKNNLMKFSNKLLDTKVLFSNIYPEKNETFSTDYLLNYYNIYKDDIKRHDALGDSILIARILLKILGEYEKRSIKNLNIIDEMKIKKFIPQPL